MTQKAPSSFDEFLLGDDVDDDDTIPVDLLRHHESRGVEYRASKIWWLITEGNYNFVQAGAALGIGADEAEKIYEEAINILNRSVQFLTEKTTVSSSVGDVIGNLTAS